MGPPTFSTETSLRTYERVSVILSLSLLMLEDCRCIIQWRFQRMAMTRDQCLLKLAKSRPYSVIARLLSVLIILAALVLTIQFSFNQFIRNYKRDDMSNNDHSPHVSFQGKVSLQSINEIYSRLR